MNMGKNSMLAWFSSWHDDSAMLSTLLGLCEGIYQSPVDSPRKRPVIRSFDFFFVTCMSCWTNSWGADLPQEHIMSGHQVNLLQATGHSKRCYEWLCCLLICLPKPGLDVSHVQCVMYKWKSLSHKNVTCYCPASRTTLVATRFRVAVICPIIQVPHCIRVFFYFVWFVFINDIFQFYNELCTYCNILDIYLS